MLTGSPVKSNFFKSVTESSQGSPLPGKVRCYFKNLV